MMPQRPAHSRAGSYCICSMQSSRTGSQAGASQSALHMKAPLVADSYISNIARRSGSIAGNHITWLHGPPPSNSKAQVAKVAYRPSPQPCHKISESHCLGHGYDQRLPADSFNADITMNAACTHVPIASLDDTEVVPSFPCLMSAVPTH